MLIIISAVVLVVVMNILIVLALLKPQPPTVSREAKLATFMPKPPKETQLVKQGYNPRSNCFDKCGYLYRTYSYTKQETVCRALFEALETFGHKSIIVDGFNRDITQKQCEDKVRQYMQKESATSYLNLDVRARMQTENSDYHYTNPSIVASVVTSFSDKTIEYQVSQTNENMILSF